ncbi:MAG: EAL domain-containing protein [Planctomycetales bacterium]|nr:EAL domain-containing protein [Planctomycetales bacterium]
MACGKFMMGVETRGIDLPGEIPQRGKLFVSSTTPDICRQLRETAHLTGFSVSEPFADVVAVELRGEGLRMLTDAWSEALSSAAQAGVRCYLSAGEAIPNCAQLMRSHSLASLKDWVNGQWLNEVIGGQRLITHFQPIVRTRNPETVFAYECLLRGQDQEGNLITPDRLYAAARGANLLDRLDSEARLTAIQSASVRALSSCVFVNFNPRSIDSPHKSLQSTLRAVLSSAIPTENFVFEVVESEEISDTDSLIDIAEHFRMAGCRVALDDVGAGYNSLNLIAILKPDFIKLDMGLIRNVDRDTYKAHVTGKLLELARDLGVRTVAEGVETESEWRWACEHGADFAQGYFFARPAAEPPRSAQSSRDLPNVTFASEIFAAAAEVDAVGADLTSAKSLQN